MLKQLKLVGLTHLSLPLLGLGGGLFVWLLFRHRLVSTDQLLLLFAELGAGEVPDGAAAAASPDPSTETAQPEQGLVPQPPEPPKPPPRRRGGRTPLPEHLPREARIVPVPEAERTCVQCGADKKCIGHRSSEILEFVPAQFKIIEEQREKLACLLDP